MLHAKQRKPHTPTHSLGPLSNRFLNCILLRSTHLLGSQDRQPHIISKSQHRPAAPMLTGPCQPSPVREIPSLGSSYSRRTPAPVMSESALSHRKKKENQEDLISCLNCQPPCLVAVKLLSPYFQDLEQKDLGPGLDEHGVPIPTAHGGKRARWGVAPAPV